MNKLKKSLCKGEIEMLPNPPAAHKNVYHLIWKGLPFLCWFLIGKPSNLWKPGQSKLQQEGTQADFPAGLPYNSIYAHLQKVGHTIYS